MFSWLKKMFTGTTPAPQEQHTAIPRDDQAPTISDPAVGFYVDPRAPSLPTDIVAGHGFLLLPNLTCERMLVDGVDGEIARATFRSSAAGARLDSLTDAVRAVLGFPPIERIVNTPKIGR